jgi:phytoene dehydrogenase-like protein
VELLDAVVVGSGPNGLVAAATLARAGRSVLVLEAADTPGGGLRSAELTNPGFLHDICSTIHPLAAHSPALRDLGITGRVELARPEVAFAHPLDGGGAAAAYISIADTARALGSDAAAYRAVFGPLLANARKVHETVLNPLFPLPRHPLLAARFGGSFGLRSAQSVVMSRFSGEPARALMAGLAAHSMLSFERAGTAGVAAFMGLTAHTSGWPAVTGGSQRIAEALVAVIEENGGRIECGRRVKTVADIPDSRLVLFDTGAAQLAAIAAEQLPKRFTRALQRFQRGPGVFKIDYALSDPIPWTAPECRRAGTVHAGGTFDQVAAAEAAVAAGKHPEKPFVLVAQTSLFDASRAPQGKHTAWAYCHVPNGSTVEMTGAIERQIERFAPGFRDTVIARHTMNCADFESHNTNYLGGDIGAGAMTLRQAIFRPAPRRSPYTTPNPRFYLCSAAAPPGPGVHGMAGWNAARKALRAL